MSESKAVRGLRVLGALVATVVAVGCSSAAPDGPNPNPTGAAPEVKDPGVSPQMNLGGSIIQVVPGTPIPQHCVYWNGSTYIYLTAHYVEKIPNNWSLWGGYNNAPNPWTGAYAGQQRLNDGYSISFPTPWITAGGTQPDPHTYEMSLWWIPSTVAWEYLVHDIQPPPQGSRLYTEDIGHSYFMVPVPSINDWDATSNLAQQNASYPVEARANQCVIILTRSGNTIYNTGESYLVDDEHDPRTPPNLCGGQPCGPS